MVESGFVEVVTGNIPVSEEAAVVEQPVQGEGTPTVQPGIGPSYQNGSRQEQQV